MYMKIKYKEKIKVYSVLRGVIYMSKLMGKIILKSRSGSDSGVFSAVLGAGLSVRYLKTSDCFEFRGYRITKEDEEKELEADGMSLADIGEKRSRSVIVVPWSVLSAMILADKIEAVGYHWSIGYETQEKLGHRPGDFGLLRDRELGFIKNSVSVGEFALVDLDSYCDLSVWQYLFNISETILHSVSVLWKKKKWGRSSSRWVSLKERRNFGGRMRGAKGVSVSSRVWDESESDFKERIEHNKKVAVSKGILSWYLDACKGECKRFGVPFDRDACIDSWNKLRKDM